MIRRREEALRAVFGRILAASVTLTIPPVLVMCSPKVAATDGGAKDDSDAACDPTAYDAGLAADADGGDPCGAFVRYACGVPTGIVPTADCFYSFEDCASLCGGILFFNCHAAASSCIDGSIPAGPVVVDCATCGGNAGRRPARLQTPRPLRAPSPLAGYFAQVAHLEAASIRAFRELARELEAHHAPRSLVRAARRARLDEVRHARVIGRFARRLGAVPPPVRVGAAVRARAGDAEAPHRTLEEIAIENAIEGCVRETYGALVATWQSRRARDPEIAAAMIGIAADETRHAALAWEIARWAARGLGAAARARVDDERRAAIATLTRETAFEPPRAIVEGAGIPDAKSQRLLLDALARGLWDAGPARTTRRRTATRVTRMRVPGARDEDARARCA